VVAAALAAAALSRRHSSLSPWPQTYSAVKIGSFSAGSNVTGILEDVPRVAAACKAGGALCFFDYAGAVRPELYPLNTSLTVAHLLCVTHKK
jgi:selenocysteine lyase/cysteine desulfurase